MIRKGVRRGQRGPGGVCRGLVRPDVREAFWSDTCHYFLVWFGGGFAYIVSTERLLLVYLGGIVREVAPEPVVLGFELHRSLPCDISSGPRQTRCTRGARPERRRFPSRLTPLRTERLSVFEPRAHGVCLIRRFPVAIVADLSRTPSVALFVPRLSANDEVIVTKRVSQIRRLVRVSLNRPRLGFVS